MKPPLGLREYYESIGKTFPKGNVCVKLLRSLYGMPQSGRNFYDTLVAALRKMGFEEKSEPCLFVRNEMIDGKVQTRIFFF